MQEDLEGSHSYIPSSVGVLFMIAGHMLWLWNNSFGKQEFATLKAYGSVSGP